MSLLAWNCRGLANSREIQFLHDIVTQYGPVFIFLSETLVKRNKVLQVCKKPGFVGCHSIDSHGT